MGTPSYDMKIFLNGIQQKIYTAMKRPQRKVNVCYDGLRFGTRQIMNHDENSRGSKLLQYEWIQIITMYYDTVRCTIRYVSNLIYG